MPTSPLPDIAAESARRTSILLVEDDADLRGIIAAGLSAAIGDVREAATLGDALRACAEQPPDLVILDLGLPDGDGAELLHRLRQATAVPLIVLSGRGDEEAKVALLDAGADDFVTKPCSAAELQARVRGLLRRTEFSTMARRAASIVLDGIEINLAEQWVRRDGVPQRLTPTEWALLRVLAMHAGRSLTVKQLWDLVWGREYGDPTVHVRVHITHLRKKIEPSPSVPRLIVTDAGVGYRLVLP